MKFKKLKIPSAADVQLAARLDLPVDGTPLAYALFAHCFTCTKNLRAVGNISDALARQGIAVLRFDFTGLGESEGDFADTNFSSNVDDLVAAAAYLAQEFEAPTILIGHSLGGAAVLQAAARIPSVRAVATIGAPADPGHIRHLLADAQPQIEAQGEAEVKLAGRTFRIKKQFLADLDQHRMAHSIGTLKKALLVMHAPLDQTVGVDNAATIFQAAKHPKSFVSLDSADHLLSNEADSRYVGAMIASWAVRYLDTAADPRETAASATRSGDAQKVVVRTEAGYRTEIMAHGHSLVADEPLEVGGTNLGPTPYDYLMASLGSCTSITLRMYADRKGWPLEAVTVRLQHNKVHAADCAVCESETGTVELIEREIEFSGPLDNAQRTRLLEIADKCPVHKTLHAEIVVQTRLAHVGTESEN